MTSCKLTCLLLLFCLFHWDSTNALCSINKETFAQCHELEDALYIDTYQLHDLRAPSSLKRLTPGHLKKFTSLRHLDLSGGKIENIATGSFAKLGSLETLNLAENRIKHLEPGSFDGLKQLHSLKLGDNNISQLPIALMSLKKLKFLDLSKNPLNCDCASMKLRDALLARGVKISKTTLCAEPLSARDLSILTGNTKTICIYEREDQEIQGDQPIPSSVESSGEENKEPEEDEALNEAEEDFSYEDEKEDVEQPTDQDTATVMTSPDANSKAPPSSSNTPAEAVEDNTSSPASSTKFSTEISSDATVDKSESVTLKLEVEHSSPTEPDMSSTELSEEKQNLSESDESKITKTIETSDKIEEESVKSSVTRSTDNLSPSTESEKTNIIVLDEGSGDTDDEGSGADHSGMISRVPAIDFSQASNNSSSSEEEEGGEEEEEEGTGISVTPKTTSTTEPLTWWNIGSSIFNNFNPWGPTEATEPDISSTTKSTEDDLKEEQFIQVMQTTTITPSEVEEPTLPSNVLLQDGGLPKEIHDIIEKDSPGEIEMENRMDMALDSKQSRQGTASYLVLGGILIVLVGLIILGACKGNFCQKKQKRRDIERGTEMKDMQKSLLEQGTQPKVQVSNGTTLENVPLMNSAKLPDEPKDHQKSYDIAPVTNGRSNGVNSELNDPVKPPRKSLNQEIEAPLNGLNPPMEDIDGPDSPCLHDESQDHSDSASYDDKPSLSLGAQKVKITMQENPDSVPKTPILITRLTGGENLVKIP